MRKPHRNYTAAEKVAILRRHLIDHIPVSDLCDQHQLSPTFFYTPGRNILRERRRSPSDHRGPETKASAQERSRRRTDGRTYPTKKRSWGTLTIAWVSPQNPRRNRRLRHPLLAPNRTFRTSFHRLDGRRAEASSTPGENATDNRSQSLSPRN